MKSFFQTTKSVSQTTKSVSNDENVFLKRLKNKTYAFFQFIHLFLVFLLFFFLTFNFSQNIHDSLYFENEKQFEQRIVSTSFFVIICGDSNVDFSDFRQVQLTQVALKVEIGDKTPLLRRFGH
jgi:hypothetical protein